MEHSWRHPVPTHKGGLIVAEHGRASRCLCTDLFEAIVQIVDCDPAEGPLLLAGEESRSLIGKRGLLQDLCYGLEDLVGGRAVLHAACTQTTNSLV